MAESGGQPGNQNAIKAKRWYDAIDRALAKRCKGDGIAALDALAEKLLAQADEGDMQALRELGDRLDGKPAQSITHGGDADNPLVVAGVTLTVVDPRAT